MPGPAPSLSLKGRALRLLSQREHSRAELQRKLSAREEEPGELARVLDELQARGFIDESRVAESVLHRRAARLGAARIRLELQAKGLGADQIAQAVASLRASEFERARQVWRRRFGGDPPADPAERARQSRFLAARGFSGEVIQRVFGSTSDDEEALG